MFKSKVFYIVTIVVVIAAGIFYKNYRPGKMNNEVAYFMKITSAQPQPTNSSVKNAIAVQKKLFGLLILTSGLPTSQDMVNGILCTENANNLEKVDLYMPDMGHGSEPPKVTPTNVPKELEKYNKTTPHFGCYNVDSMQLFMPGLWQVRVFYKDGSIGIFDVDLKK